MDVGDRWLQRRRRRAAHALAERDADAGRPALERAEHQLAADIAVEARPVESGRDSQSRAATLAMLAIASGSPAVSASARLGQLAVERGLVRRLDLEVVHQSSLTFPRPCLTVPRCFLLSTRFALAARLGRVACASPADMGLGDQFRQPRAAHPRGWPPGCGTARGDHDLAGRGHPAPGERLQPLDRRPGAARAEHVAAQLAGGRDLVDVLPARPGRGEEAFPQRVFGNASTSSGRIAGTRRRVGGSGAVASTGGLRRAARPAATRRGAASALPGP